MQIQQCQMICFAEKTHILVEKGADFQKRYLYYNKRPSSCHICRIPTPGALILNHLQEAKTTEKSWSLTTNSKFNAICCWVAAVLHLNFNR